MCIRGFAYVWQVYFYSIQVCDCLKLCVLWIGACVCLSMCWIFNYNYIYLGVVCVLVFSLFFLLMELLVSFQTWFYTAIVLVFVCVCVWGYNVWHTSLIMCVCLMYNFVFVNWFQTSTLLFDFAKWSNSDDVAVYLLLCCDCCITYTSRAILVNYLLDLRIGNYV